MVYSIIKVAWLCDMLLYIKHFAKTTSIYTHCKLFVFRQKYRDFVC